MACICGNCEQCYRRQQIGRDAIRWKQRGRRVTVLETDTEDPCSARGKHQWRIDLTTGDITCKWCHEVR